MSAYDYLLLVKRSNAELFKAKKVIVKVSDIEALIIRSFEAGEKAGFKNGKESKSIFQTVFGE